MNNYIRGETGETPEPAKAKPHASVTAFKNSPAYASAPTLQRIAEDPRYQQKFDNFIAQNLDEFVSLYKVTQKTAFGNIATDDEALVAVIMQLETNPVTIDGLMRFLGVDEESSFGLMQQRGGGYDINNLGRDR
jgi:hypothetical protein